MGTFQQYLVVFLEFESVVNIQEGSLSPEEVLPNGAIAYGKQWQCSSLSVFVWLQPDKASITVKTFSAVGERQRLIDTTIILYSWTTFYVVIATGYAGGRSQAEGRKDMREGGNKAVA